MQIYQYNTELTLLHTDMNVKVYFNPCVFHTVHRGSGGHGDHYHGGCCYGACVGNTSSCARDNVLCNHPRCQRRKFPFLQTLLASDKYNSLMTDIKTSSFLQTCLHNAKTMLAQCKDNRRMII